jgi:hypothetical protein
MTKLEYGLHCAENNSESEATYIRHLHCSHRMKHMTAKTELSGVAALFIMSFANNLVQIVGTSVSAGC